MLYLWKSQITVVERHSSEVRVSQNLAFQLNTVAGGAAPCQAADGGTPWWGVACTPDPVFVIVAEIMEEGVTSVTSAALVA